MNEIPGREADIDAYSVSPCPNDSEKPRSHEVTSASTETRSARRGLIERCARGRRLYFEGGGGSRSLPRRSCRPRNVNSVYIAHVWYILLISLGVSLVTTAVVESKWSETYDEGLSSTRTSNEGLLTGETNGLGNTRDISKFLLGNFTYMTIDTNESRVNRFLTQRVYRLYNYNELALCPKGSD